MSVVAPSSSVLRDMRDRWKRRLVLSTEWIRAAVVLAHSSSSAGRDPVASAWGRAVVSFVGSSDAGSGAVASLLQLHAVRVQSQHVISLNDSLIVSWLLAP